MANINLHQSVESTESLRKKPSFFTGRTFLSILMLVITFAAFGGLKYYQSYLVTTRDQLISEKKAIMMNMDKDEIAQAIDFDNRINSINYNIENRTNPGEDFGLMENLLLSNVSLNDYSYEFDGKTIALSVVADNFESVAEQMWNFKKSKEFSSVEVMGSSLDGEGKTIFDLELTKN